MKLLKTSQDTWIPIDKITAFAVATGKECEDGFKYDFGTVVYTASTPQIVVIGVGNKVFYSQGKEYFDSVVSFLEGNTVNKID
jgi:hypothetical protein